MLTYTWGVDVYQVNLAAILQTDDFSLCHSQSSNALCTGQDS